MINSVPSRSPHTSTDISWPKHAEAKLTGFRAEDDSQMCLRRRPIIGTASYYRDQYGASLQSGECPDLPTRFHFAFFRPTLPVLHGFVPPSEFARIRGCGLLAPWDTSCRVIVMEAERDESWHIVWRSCERLGIIFHGPS